ncbi:MAG TPA: hypothetical protein PLI62_11560 [Spirochaetota bacterium]|nr:hypothetical protein [Spirochaetota bacterium]
MMLRMIITALCLTVAITGATAATENPDITRIRALYEDARKKDCGDDCEHYNYTVTLNSILPATGPQTKNIKFTLTAEQANPREDPYLFRRHLHKVTVSWNISASAQYTVEYLYDEKERPVFFFHKEEGVGGGSEKRMYFAGNRLIRFDTVSLPDPGNKGRSIRDSGFNENEIREARTILHRALRYRKLFRTLAEACDWN